MSPAGTPFDRLDESLLMLPDVCIHSAGPPVFYFWKQGADETVCGGQPRSPPRRQSLASSRNSNTNILLVRHVGWVMFDWRAGYPGRSSAWQAKSLGRMILSTTNCCYYADRRPTPSLNAQHTPADTARHGHVCVRMCVGMCVGMCVRMCVGMCVGMCIGMCVDMCVGMCVVMCVDMCVGMCVGMWIDLYVGLV